MIRIPEDFNDDLSKCNLFCLRVDNGGPVQVCTSTDPDFCGLNPEATKGDILLGFIRGATRAPDLSKNRVRLFPILEDTENRGEITLEEYDRLGRITRDPYRLEFSEDKVHFVASNGVVLQEFHAPGETPPSGHTVMTLVDLLSNDSIVWAQGRPPPETLNYVREQYVEQVTEYVRKQNRQFGREPVPLTEVEEDERSWRQQSRG